MLRSIALLIGGVILALTLPTTIIAQDHFTPSVPVHSAELDYCVGTADDESLVFGDPELGVLYPLTPPPCQGGGGTIALSAPGLFAVSENTLGVFHSELHTLEAPYSIVLHTTMDFTVPVDIQVGLDIVDIDGYTPPVIDARIIEDGREIVALSEQTVTSFTARAGRVYTISCTTSSNAFFGIAEYSLFYTLRFGASFPSNAIIVGDGSTPFRTNSLETSGETLSDAACPGALLGDFYRDSWFEYEATSTGPLEVAVCGATFDTDLGLYQGSPGSLTVVGCNGDSPGCVQSDGTTPFASRFVAEVVAGETYFVRVGGYSTAQDDDGSGVLTIAPLGPVLDSACALESITASDASPDDRFGTAISISGDVAIVGAPRLGTGEPGSAYVYRRSGSGWVEEQVLSGFLPIEDGFGVVVAIDGNLAAVGPSDAVSGPSFLFRYDPLLGSWAFESSLATDGGIAVCGDLIAAGDLSFDAVFVFQDNGPGSDLTLPYVLFASDGAPDDLFGQSVDFDGDVIVVGASESGGSGAAYVFRFDGSDWVEEQKLIAASTSPGDQFGYRVAVSGDAILVGARKDDDQGIDSGAAFVFRYDGTSWIEEAQLQPQAGTAQDGIGSSVSLEGDVAIVGAPGDTLNGAGSGSASVFRFDGANWNETALLTPDSGSTGDEFARFDIGLDNGTILIGSWRDDGAAGTDQGSAQFFALPDAASPTDLECTPLPGPSPSIDLAWLNSDGYESIEVFLDGVSVEVLPGGTTLTSIPATDSTHDVCIRATSLCGEILNDICCTVTFGTPYVRGDCNGDQAINIADAISILSGLFSGEPITCIDACNTNADAGFDIADAISTLSFLFSSGPAPTAPYPDCGVLDQLGCDSFPPCEAQPKSK